MSHSAMSAETNIVNILSSLNAALAVPPLACCNTDWLFDAVSVQVVNLLLFILCLNYHKPHILHMTDYLLSPIYFYT